MQTFSSSVGLLYLSGSVRNPFLLKELKRVPTEDIEIFGQNG